MKKLAIFAAVMVVGAGVALASTLNVPFFLDNSNQNVDGFVGVKEAAGVPQTLTVIYTVVDTSGTVLNQTVTFALGANRAVSWQPVQSTATENEGSIVPNSTNESSPGNVKRSGSLRIISSQANGITGRYQEIRATSQFAHVLIG